MFNVLYLPKAVLHGIQGCCLNRVGMQSIQLSLGMV